MNIYSNEKADKKVKFGFKIEDRSSWSNNFTKLFEKKSVRMLLRWLAKRVVKFKK